MKKVLCGILVSILLGCNSQSAKGEGVIVIKKNWDLENFRLNHSTLGDFKHQMNARDFEFKQEVRNDFPTSEIDDILYSLENKDLGIRCTFEKRYPSEDTLFKNYEITDFEHIKFEQGFTNVISNEQLNHYFRPSGTQNLYETRIDKNNVLIAIIPKSEGAYEIIAVNVSHEGE